MNKDIEVTSPATLEERNLKNLIHVIRGKEVILDSDLAKLYQVETKVLNKARNRNSERFPSSFCFQLAKEEYDNLKFQIGTSSFEHGGRRYLPFVFTEQGVAMLSSILHSDTAIRTSVCIMNAFVEMRHFVSDNNLLLEKIENIDFRLLDHDKKFEEVFEQLATRKEVSQKIFFEGQIYDAYSLLVDLIQRAEKSIILVDSYVSKTTLDILSKKNPKILVDVYTFSSSKLSKIDVEKFNAEYPILKVHHTNRFHDRFLILDRKDAYLVGASLKDAGKKAFAITKIEDQSIIDKLLVVLDHK